MKSQKSETSTCYLLPEMVDIGMSHLAEEKDVRRAVTKARRAAGLLNGRNQVRGTGLPQAPTWPLEPGSLAEAVYWYRQMAGLGEVTDPDAVAASLNNLGYAWREQQRWDEAEAAFQESLQLHRQYGNRAGEGHTMRDVGQLYQAQGRWADAESAFTQSLAIAREVVDRYGEMNALGNLGLACAALGQADRAVSCLEQAAALAHEIGQYAFQKRMREHLANISRRS